MAGPEIKSRDPGDPGADTAAYDPAASGAMGDQSGGGDYPHPELGVGHKGRAKGGQSNPAYSGTGRLAGEPVDARADQNAVTHGGSDNEPPAD